jgi:hypothetical protein
MRGALIVMAGAIGLAGCEQHAAAPANSTAGEQAAASPGANAVADADGSLPPPTGLRFVGLWASDVKDCSTAAWRFTDTSLSTATGSHCTFSKVTAVPGGYDIAASCIAQGPAKADRIKIRFAESTQAMLFDSDAISDTGLVYCGREG